MASALLRGLVKRLREADQKIGSLALMDVYGRVARRIRALGLGDFELARRHGARGLGDAIRLRGRAARRR